MYKFQYLNDAFCYENEIESSYCIYRKVASNTVCFRVCSKRVLPFDETTPNKTSLLS